MCYILRSHNLYTLLIVVFFVYINDNVHDNVMSCVATHSNKLFPAFILYSFKCVHVKEEYSSALFRFN